MIVDTTVLMTLDNDTEHQADARRSLDRFS